MKKDIQMMIIPDVHGRSFWKEAVASCPDAEVVFLGDYLDTYANEHISEQTAMDVFKEIIDIKRARPENVHLLIGNHDISYIDQRFGCSRHMYLAEDEIRSVYKDAEGCFDLAYGTEINGRRFLLSHAGVSKGWLASHKDIFGSMPICSELFNLMYQSDSLRELIVSALSDVSIVRWGDADFGSMIWADVQEMMHPDMQIPGFVQIFGHSQQEIEPCCLRDKAYCLDCRRVFYIDSFGNIRDFNTDRIVGEDKYIFLDIDGVLTTGRSGHRMDPICFEKLGTLLDETDAKIVVTSSWKGLTVKETVGNLTDRSDSLVGFNPFPFAERIVGVTRDWHVIDDDCPRGKEIAAFLKMHSCSSYAIIDDVQDFLPDQQSHFVQTRDSIGLSDEGVAKAKEILLRNSRITEI